MNFSHWKDSAEIVGAIGVMATLIFVAFEIRQNTDAVRSATMHALSEQSRNSVALFIENGDLRDAFHAINEGHLTEDQTMVLRAFYGNAMRIMENRFVQVRIGVFEEEDIWRFGARSRVYDNPYFETYWADRKTHYSADFREFVEREILPQSLESSVSN